LYAAYRSNENDLVMMRIGLAVGMALYTTQTQALDNGLGRRPGLGWNSDYCTNCSVRSCRQHRLQLLPRLSFQTASLQLH
jgi:hypothetical protein